MVVTSNCEGGITYSLDFQAESIHERNLWLTEADGDLAFDEEVDALVTGLQFLNFDNACEDRYTLSVGYYDTDDNPYPGDYGKELRVREFAAVPNGSVVDLQSAGVNGNVFRGLMPNWLIAIPNCPPIDSALLQVKLDPLAPNAPTTPFYFDYSLVLVYRRSLGHGSPSAHGFPRCQHGRMAGGNPRFPSGATYNFGL